MHLIFINNLKNAVVTCDCINNGGDRNNGGERNNGGDRNNDGERNNDGDRINNDYQDCLSEL